MKIGLTGGIGSGKTTVARVLEQLGAAVYYADEHGRRISDNNPEIVLKIKSLLGDDAYRPDGTLDRRRVAQRVFSDPALLEGLDAIVHPAVREDFERWAEEHAEAPYTVLESAILFESGFAAAMDRVVVVAAPEALRIARVMRRDGTDQAAVRARIEAQLPQDELIARADEVLWADDHTPLIPRIVRLHEKLLSLRKIAKP